MDADIEFGNVEQAPPQTQLRPDRNLHYAVVPVYGPSDRDLPVFVDLDVLRDMESHAQSNRHVELGGVMLGGQFADEQGRPFVVVTDSLRAQHYESTKGSFKFTHDTWEQITRERERFPAEMQMVGWYHTHPDWGVFLSGLDMFICDNFFNRPLDVALVIDPCRRDRGFFQWTSDSGSRIRRTDGFYLTASRFRAAELRAHADLLESTTNMPHDPHAMQASSYATPVIHVVSPPAPWQAAAVWAMFALQFCFLLLIMWRLTISDQPGRGNRELAGAQVTQEKLDSQRRAADLDAKLQVLELVVRQGSNAPEGVLRSLSEHVAQVNELRSSLRGQQSLTRELEGKLRELEGSLADAQRREKRHESEVVAMQTRVSALMSKLEALQEQSASSAAKSAENGEAKSWWSLFRAHATPVSLGALVGAAVIGAVVAVVQWTRRSMSELSDEPSRDSQSDA
jgi:proteasome lid subunit RPN8/RPN11